MPHKLKPIKPKRISDQVFDQLRELIFRGEFKTGEQILTERELAEAFGVSRTSVRDAINKLVVMGLLEQRQGQGTFVRSPESSDKSILATMVESQGASITDLLEVRMGLECNAAAMAATRAVEKDFQFMEKSIQEMQQEVQSGRLGTEADASFHIVPPQTTPCIRQIPFKCMLRAIANIIVSSESCPTSIKFFTFAPCCVPR